MISRALWLQAGDENTKFFHHFANGRNLFNTIWSIDRRDGTKETSFGDIAHEGTLHFESLFKSDSRVNIDTIIKVVSPFSKFINLEENKKLVEEITKEELEKILHSF